MARRGALGTPEPGPRRRWLRRLVLSVLLVGVVGSPIWCAWLALEDVPLVPRTRALEAEDAYRARALALRTQRRVADAYGRSRLVFTEAELESLAVVAARALPRLASSVRITAAELDGAASIELPAGMPWRYVNLRAVLLPSSDGVRLDHVSLGRVRVPGGLALRAVQVLGDLVLGDGRVGAFLGAVEGVELAAGRAIVQLDVDPELRIALFAARERARGVRDELGLLGDPELIGVYRDRIAALDSGFDGAGRRSLGRYVGPLFALARERSREGDPVAENEALILAVATYFGSHRFAALTGAPSSTSSSASSSALGLRRRGAITLAGRTDLRLHFAISAGIEVLSNRDISIAVGELKEILDTERGGSGFSFTDLAADRAGVRLALTATASPQSARRVQEALAAGVSESAFFPAIEGLEDGLSRTTFERVYGGVEGARYRELVAEIDRRIAALPAHRR
jgi:uncharacterized protein YfiM (DUF2279 family)